MNGVHDPWYQRPEPPPKITPWQYSIYIRIGLLVWTALMVGCIVWALVDDSGNWTTYLWAVGGVAALLFLWDYVCRRRVIRP